MKQFIVLTVVFVATFASAQRGNGKNGKPIGVANNYTISGQVVEAGSNQSIDYATVTIIDNATNKIQSGTTTESGGLFNMTSKTKDIYIEISFIGYSTKKIDVITFDGQKADLGLIKLGEDSQKLDEVVVTAQKSTTEFKLDKRVFNVGSDLSSTGASAL